MESSIKGSNRMKQLSTKKRLGHLGIGCAMFFLLFVAGSFTPLSTVEADMLLSAMAVQTATLMDEIDPMFIAIHNITIALPMMIPGFGFIWGDFAGFQTGLLISAMATTVEEFDAWMGMLLFVTPVGILELAAYGLGMSRSWLIGRVLFMKKYRTKENLKAMVKPVIIESIIIVGLLVIGGYVEAWMITEFGSDTLALLEKYQ